MELLYADDIVLLVESPEEVQMLDMHWEDWKFSFNASMIVGATSGSERWRR